MNVNKRSMPLERRPEHAPEGAHQDLSQDWKGTFTMGRLIPFYITETLPGDKFKINANFMFRFAPLYFPLMHRINMAADWFYIPNRIMWPGLANVSGGDNWETFITTEDGNVQHPVYTIIDNVYSQRGSIIDHMGWPTQDLAAVSPLASVTVNAFPLFAYFLTWDTYYRNDQVQARRADLYLVGGLNSLPVEFVATNGTPWMRNWPRDNYTSCTPLPQLGEAVLIPMLSLTNDFGASYPDQYLVESDTGNIRANAVLHSSPTGNLEDAASSERLILDMSATAATISELRFAIQLEEYMEKAMRAGDKYPDQTWAFWNVKLKSNLVQEPLWIGGKKGSVIVSEVMSTAKTTNASSQPVGSVGDYAGQAMVLEQAGGIEYECNEHGILLALMSVYPQASYSQGLDKMWTRSSKFDYPWPQFANIGDEEVLNQEVMYIASDAVLPEIFNRQTFGYRPKYSDWRYKNDVYSGYMKSTFIYFHLGRIFDDTDLNLGLNDQFLQCEPRILDTFEIVEGDPEIYGWVHNDVSVYRKLPKYGIPNL